MAFDIRRFKSEIDDFHRPSYYEVQLSPPTGGGRLFRIRTETVNVPGVSYLSADNYRPYGSGLMYTIPYSHNPQEISCVHTLDRKGELLQILIDWANITVDLYGDAKFGAHYYDDYTVKQMQVFCYDSQGQKIKTFTLYNVFLQSLDQIPLSWESSNEITRLNVNYKYTHFRIT